MKIRLTEAAKAELRSRTDGNGKSPKVFFAGFGCSQPKLGITVDTKRDKDIEVESEDGTTFLIEEQLNEIMEELSIDYEAEGIQAGFKISQGSKAGK